MKYDFTTIMDRGGRNTMAVDGYGMMTQGITIKEGCQHHRLDRHEFELTLGVGDGQGGLVCCSPWSRRVGHN